MSIYETSIINSKKQLKFYKNLSEQLEKDNQELKEQLEAVKQVAKDHLKKEIELKIQQKEFIEWLEKEIKETREKWGNALTNESLLDVAMTVAAYEEILSKYKEIIGVKDE